MNQRIADLVLALPAPLRDVGVMSIVFLGFCWLAYTFFIRTPLRRRVHERCPAKYLAETVPRAYQRLFYTAVRKRAALDGFGWYAVNRWIFWLLVVLTPVQLTMVLALWRSLPPLLILIDTTLLSLFFSLICLLALMTQPAATMERRRSWGFRPMGNVIHTVLWEGILTALLFYWFYIAYFVGML